MHWLLKSVCVKHGILIITLESEARGLIVLSNGITNRNIHRIFIGHQQFKGDIVMSEIRDPTFLSEKKS